MAVTSSLLLAILTGGDLPDTIVRPGISVSWVGGTGPFDVEYTWDDDASFANGNGNRQIRTYNSVTSPHTGVPTADLGDLTVQWYLRVIITATGDLQNEIWSIDHDHTGGTFDLTFDGNSALNIPWNETNANLETAIEGITGLTNVTVTGSTGNWTVEVVDPGNQDLNQITIDGTNLTGGTTATATTDTEGHDGIGGTGTKTGGFTYFLTNPLDRTHLHHQQNVGVGFHDTDEPTAGWGTGGTEGPDGNIWEDFRRYLSHIQNVGVGFGKDEPGAGWGPNTPSTDAPDGENIDFRRDIYHLQNVDTTQPCPFMFSLSQAQIRVGQSLTVTGQGLVSASSPTADAYDAEVRLYESPSFAASFVTLSITDWVSGSTEDSITATIPGGAASGFIAVVHTTTPSCSGSNFIGLTVIAKDPDRQAGWWVEVWDIRNTTKVVAPLPLVAEATFEHIANDIGNGAVFLRGDDEDIAEIVDRTTNPETQRLVKIYLHDRFAYSFIPVDAEEEYDEDGARKTRLFGDGQERILKWGRCLWKDHPAQPTTTRTWLYGSTVNAVPWGNMEGSNEIDNGGFEDAAVDPAAKVGTAALFADTAEARTGAWSLRVTPAALDDGVEWEYGVENRQTFADLHFKVNTIGGTYTVELIAADDTIIDTVATVTATAVWTPINVDGVPDSGETWRLRITQTAGTLAQFWVDDVAAYARISGTISANRSTYQLSRTHVAEGLHSMELAMDAGGDATFNGIIGFFPVTPNEEYTVRIPVSGTALEVVRVAARFGGTVDSVEQALTGLGTFDIITVSGTAGPEETTSRFAISSKESGAMTVFVDDITIQPGSPAANPGEIVIDVHTAMVARGTLDFVQLGFGAVFDSGGIPWPEKLPFEVDPQWTMWDLLEKFIGLGYSAELVPVNWREGGDTGWELNLYAPGSAGVDWSLFDDGPAILPGDTLRDVEPSSAPPAETVVYGEGSGGVWTVAEASAARLTNLERREGFIKAAHAKDTVTLNRIAQHRLATSLERGAQWTGKLTDDADPLPYFDFIPHDRLRSHLPTDGARDAVADDTYLVAALVFRGTGAGVGQEYEGDFGRYKLHAQRLRDLIMARQLQRESSENYQPGTGSVSSTGGSGGGGTTPASSDAPEITFVPPHDHVWSDVGPPVGGDLAGSFPEPMVAGIRDRRVSSAAPDDADHYEWDDGNSEWTPVASPTSGDDTIADAATTEVVAHGLAATPTTIVVTPQGNEAVWVTTVGATNFTLNRSGSTGALGVFWTAIP